jgi:hypothetical protein
MLFVHSRIVSGYRRYIRDARRFSLHDAMYYQAWPSQGNMHRPKEKGKPVNERGHVGLRALEFASCYLSRERSIWWRCVLPHAGRPGTSFLFTAVTITGWRGVQYHINIRPLGGFLHGDKHTAAGTRCYGKSQANNCSRTPRRKLEACKEAIVRDSMEAW